MLFASICRGAAHRFCGLQVTFRDPPMQFPYGFYTIYPKTTAITKQKKNFVFRVQEEPASGRLRAIKG